MATSASRDTTTGTNYETEVENLLEEFSDHKVESQVMVGAKLAWWKTLLRYCYQRRRTYQSEDQRVQGTAEEKIPFEFMKLQHAIDDHGYKSATIVVAGPDKAWKWKDYYLSNDFRAKMKSIYPDVRISITINLFI